MNQIAKSVLARRRSLAALVPLVASLALFGPSNAQAPTAPAAGAAPATLDDPEAKLSPELVGKMNGITVSPLVVRAPGPAWWTVTNGKRTVYVLGAIWSMPYGQAWNKSTLVRHLSESSAVILPPILTGTADVHASLVVHPPLDVNIEHRLTNIANAVGMPPSRYLGHSAVQAGILLLSDFSLSRGDRTGVVANTVARVAQENGVLATYAKVIPAPVAANFESVGEKAGLTCLVQAMDEVTAGPQPFKDAIQGWAEGDVRKALSEPRGLELCGLTIPHQAEQRRQTAKDEAAAMSDWLSKIPGPTMKSNGAIFVVNLRTLVAEGGILDQLRAKNYTVQAPQF